MQELIDHVLGLLRHAWRGRWLALGLCWLVCLIGWSVVTLQPDRYQSSARIYADTDSLLSSLVPGLALSRNVEGQIDVMQQTILSGPNVQQVLESAGIIPAGADPESGLVRKAASALRAGTSIVAEKPNLFHVAYTDRDPQLATKVVSGLLEAFTRSGLGASQGQIELAEGFLDEELASSRSELSAAEQALTAFLEANGDVVGGTQSHAQRLQQARGEATDLRGSLALARAQQAELERQLALTPRSLGASGFAGVQALSPREAELARMRETLADLRGRFTGQHPDVLAAEKTVARLEADLAANPSPVAAGPSNPLYDQIRLQLAQARATTSSLQARSEQAEARVVDLAASTQVAPEAEAQLRRLTSDYELVKRNYEQLVQRRESARFAGALDARTARVDFRIVDPPSTPDWPSSPNRRLLMLAVLVGGIVAGAGISVLLGVLEAPFESVKALQKAFDLRVLGVTSRLRRPVDRRRAWRGLAGFSLCCGLLLVLLAGFVLAERSHLSDQIRARIETSILTSSIGNGQG